MNYEIITDEVKLDEFIEFLPDHTDTEVYYICLFGRHKYVTNLPNAKDNTLARVTARKSEIKEKIRRFEVPFGAYVRDGQYVPQEALAVYIGVNPRSLIKASRQLLIELATRIANGSFNFNPVTAATTEVHRATDRKFHIDFDYDDVEPADYLPQIQSILPDGTYKIIKTRGGFHVLVDLVKIKGVKTNWHKGLSSLAKCDVRGCGHLTPIPGCTQGGFTPYFWTNSNCAKG